MKSISSRLLTCISTTAVLVLLGACGKQETPQPQAQTQAAPQPATPQTATPPLNIAGGNYRVYVTNEMSGDLTAIDATDHSIIGTFELGKRPRGAQVSPDGKMLYVALSGSPVTPPGVDPATVPPADKSADGIGLFDTTEHRLIDVLRGFSDPEQLAVSLDGSRIYVASEDTGKALIADGHTGDVRATLPVGGEPEGVALSVDGKHVYVTSEENHSISVIDTATEKVVSTFDVGERPRDIAFSPDGKRAYISGESDASVTIVDATTNKPIGTLKIPGENARPMGVVVSPDNSHLFVATGRGGTVVAIDTNTREVLGTVKVGERPWGIAISPDGNLLYTANGPSNDVSVVDAHKLQLLGNIPAGQRPWGVAIVQNL